MKAVVYVEPGRLEIEERPLPAPLPEEALVRVSHVGICGSDLLLWEGGFDRVTPPVIVGHEFSGVIEDPNGAPDLSAGDRVVVEPLIACGECALCVTGDYNACVRLGLYGIDRDGAAASHVAVSWGRIHHIPASLSLRHAALAEPTAVACHMVSRAEVSSGSTVLVVGGGPIGVLVAAVCRTRGAARVVVSEPGDDRRERASETGAETFDPRSGTPASLLGEDAAGFDVAFELTGVEAGLASAVEACRPKGTVLLGGLPHKPIPLSVSTAVLKELTLRGSRVYRAEDVEQAIALLAANEIPAEFLITREVPLERSLEDAYVRLRDLRTDMKILITPGMEST